MANHIRNFVKFSGDQKQIDDLFESIKGEEGRILDFNKITPMPRWIYGSQPDVTGIRQEDYEKYGRENTSIDWAYTNWGTKWNAYDAERKGNEMQFETANGAVPQLMQKLAWIYPKVLIEYEFYDSTNPFGGNRYMYTFKDTDWTEKSEPLYSEEELNEMFGEEDE